MIGRIYLLSFVSVIAVLIVSGCTSQATANVAAKEELYSQLPSPSIQEINMRAEPLGYDPDYITVKKGIPVKINIAASQDAGCTRSIVFPDFGINKVIPRGGSGVIEFTPTKEGTYQFRCSMNMAKGTLVVTG